MIHEIDLLLTRWGEAMSRGGSRYGSGYAAVSYDRGGSGSDCSHIALVTPDVLDTDAMVKALPNGPRVAVVEFYLHADASLAQRMQSAHMSKSTLYRNRDRAHELIYQARYGRPYDPVEDLAAKARRMGHV